jgi:hypothetical protein
MEITIKLNPDAIKVLTDLTEHEWWSYNFEDTIELCDEMVEMGLLKMTYFNNWPAYSITPLGSRALIDVNNDYNPHSLVKVIMEETANAPDLSK